MINTCVLQGEASVNETKHNGYHPPLTDTNSPVKSRHQTDSKRTENENESRVQPVDLRTRATATGVRYFPVAGRRYTLDTALEAEDVSQVDTDESAVTRR